MGTSYEADIVTWAEEQAALLREGKLTEIDTANLAEEIEDVGKSERRELANRMALLLAHLLEWQYQPERRGSSWQRTIREQRRAITTRIRETPGLKTSLSDANWWEGVWADALTKAIDETGLDHFPENCPWPTEQILSTEFYPSTE